MLSAYAYLKEITVFVLHLMLFVEETSNDYFPFFFFSFFLLVVIGYQRSDMCMCLQMPVHLILHYKECFVEIKNTYCMDSFLFGVSLVM